MTDVAEQPDTRTQYSHRASKRVDDLPDNLTYLQMIAESRRCMGHGAEAGAFPEEWDAQMLVDCGRAASGERVVLFAPAFLKVLLGDENELQRAFQFIMLMMDGVAMKEKYTFIYCHSGTNWLNPLLTSRVRIAYDMMPPQYADNCKRFIVLHPTWGFRMTMTGFWGWLSGKIWSKMEYVDTLEALCQQVHPSDPTERSELRRRFPQLIQREDCLIEGTPPPTAFGAPLENLTNTFGIDFTDKTTGRWYPRLPPALIFLCEALERQNAVVEFAALYGSNSQHTSDLVADVDEGEPLDPDTPTEALWCVLKLYLDCLPEPLFTFESLTRLASRGVKVDDRAAHHTFVKEIMHDVPDHRAHASLYLASFLHTMCENASNVKPVEGVVAAGGPPALSFETAAQVFASAFMRPVTVNQEAFPLLPVCVAVVETFIRQAEDKDLWLIGEGKAQPGRRQSQQPRRSLLEMPDPALLELAKGHEEQDSDSDKEGEK